MEVMNPLSKIRWENPPKIAARPPRPRSVWQRRLFPLKARPGKWARVAEMKVTSAYTAVAALNNGRYTKFGIYPREWEFTSRNVNGRGFIYARYMNGVDRGPFGESEES